MKKSFRFIRHCSRAIYYESVDRPVRIFDHRFHIDQAMKWLGRAQDSGADGGVSEGYHLYHGWLPAYPETTGYLIDTFFDYFQLSKNETARGRAIQMGDWLVSIQN